jgi:hypothetical protein
MDLLRRMTCRACLHWNGATPPARATSFTLRNEGCDWICRPYLSPPGCDDWGVEWIRPRVLRSGESVTIQIPPGRYDVLVENCLMVGRISEGHDAPQEEPLVVHDVGVENVAACQTALIVEYRGTEDIGRLFITTDWGIDHWGYDWIGTAADPAGRDETYRCPVRDV